MGEKTLSELHNFLELWRELYHVERKVAASELGVSPTQYWRVETGHAPLSMERMRTLGRISDCSLNSLLLAFMLMDDNIDRSNSNDPGDRLILWLHNRLASQARCNETNSATRHFLGRPQSLESVFDALNQSQKEGETEPPSEATRYSVAASG